MSFLEQEEEEEEGQEEKKEEEVVYQSKPIECQGPVYLGETKEPIFTVQQLKGILHLCVYI